MEGIVEEALRIRPYVAGLTDGAPVVTRRLRRPCGLEFPAAHSNGAEWHTSVAFIALAADEPERQSSRIVRRSPRSSRRSYAERALSPSLPPPATFHNHANQYANRLSESCIAPGVYAREELINGRLRFKLSHKASQRGAVVVQFGFFHTPLAVHVVKELKHNVERLVPIVDNIGERLSLAIVQKVVSRHACFRHFPFSSLR
jgi:hypothetical protein